MNIHRPLRERIESEMSPEGMVTIPEYVRRVTGLVPGRPVVVGLNDRGEAVILTRTQAKRLGETPAETVERVDRALDAIGARFSTGQTTAEVMEELRGSRDA